MDIEERLRTNYYQNKFPYASSKKDLEVHEAYQNEGIRLHSEFKADLKAYMEVSLGPLTLGQFQAVFNLAWNEGHSSGHFSVFNFANELLSVLEVFVKK